MQQPQPPRIEKSSSSLLQIMYLFIRIERYPGPVSPGPSEIRTDFRCHAYHKSEPFSATNVLQIPYGCKNSVKIGLRSAMGHRNALSLFRAAYRPTQRHRKRFMKREIFPTLLVSVLCLLAACTGTGDGQEPVRNIIFMIGDGMGCRSNGPFARTGLRPHPDGAGDIHGIQKPTPPKGASPIRQRQVQHSPAAKRRPTER